MEHRSEIWNILTDETVNNSGSIRALERTLTQPVGVRRVA